MMARSAQRHAIVGQSAAYQEIGHGGGAPWWCLCASGLCPSSDDEKTRLPCFEYGELWGFPLTFFLLFMLLELGAGC